MDYKYTEISIENIYEHSAVEGVFNNIYGLTIKSQFTDLIKQLDNAGYVICKKEGVN